MSRAWIWLQIALGWLPVWALFTMMIAMAHGAPVSDAALSASRLLAAAALLGVAVHRFTARLPWPHPMQARFILTHMLAATMYASAWFLLNSAIASVIESVQRGSIALTLVLGPGIVPFVVMGVWLYVMVAGVTYANHAAQRAAQTDALAARSQLAALRAQLHPHFLFNALHTMVQLIPLDPRGAVRAAEQLAGALRTTIEEQRDLVPLADEWAFVQRYLAIESIRFGDRLRVHDDIDADARLALLPSFALQTLVENAIRHGAAPRAQPTTLSISASVDGEMLNVIVGDDGAGVNNESLKHTAGTGLQRLRDRLNFLYGTSAQLDLESSVGNGFRASLSVPRMAIDTDAHALSLARTDE